MIDTDVVNPIKTDNPDFDVFFNTDKTLHEMLENPGAYEIGLVSPPQRAEHPLREEHTDEVLPMPVLWHLPPHAL